MRFKIETSADGSSWAGLYQSRRADHAKSKFASLVADMDPKMQLRLTDTKTGESEIKTFEPFDPEPIETVILPGKPGRKIVVDQDGPHYEPAAVDEPQRGISEGPEAPADTSTPPEAEVSPAASEDPGDETHTKICSICLEPIVGTPVCVKDTCQAELGRRKEAEMAAARKKTNKRQSTAAKAKGKKTASGRQAKHVGDFVGESLSGLSVDDVAGLVTNLLDKAFDTDAFGSDAVTRRKVAEGKKSIKKSKDRAAGRGDYRDAANPGSARMSLGNQVRSLCRKLDIKSKQSLLSYK